MAPRPATWHPERQKRAGCRGDLPQLTEICYQSSHPDDQVLSVSASARHVNRLGSSLCQLSRSTLRGPIATGHITLDNVQSWPDTNDPYPPYPQEPELENGYLVFFQPPVGSPVSLEYPLALEEIVLKHDTREIRARLRGDEVVGMENFGTDLTYFDPLE